MDFNQIKHIHFVGIGGIGMSGIAEILSQSGVTVSGCDLKRSAATDLLEKRGIRVAIGHHSSHLEGVDLIVITAAVKGHNSEIDTARVRRIPILRRAEILGELVNSKRSVGVAGTHGKTTTSAMIACILEEAGLDPTILVGGVLRNFDTNAKQGRSEFLVVEADEYDRTFHDLHPEIAVVTNVEPDHLEYYGSFEAIVEAFRLFLEGIAPGGAIVGCIDDPVVARLLDEAASARIVRYGLTEDADLRAVNIEFSERGSSFEVSRAAKASAPSRDARSKRAADERVGFFKLFVPGEHNIRNALGAIGVALELGIDTNVIASALAKFLGVDRRFQILGDYAGAIIVDDYAHHPTEIRATLEAARRGYPQRRIIALFQPHLYSRTRDFAREFAEALRVADISIVAPIYAAREQPMPGISARLIADATGGIEFLDRSNAEIFNEMRRRLKPDDLFITMGAGDVHEIAEMLVRGGAGEVGA